MVFYNYVLVKVLLVCLVLLSVSTFYFVAYHPEDFSDAFAREDGIVEYPTAILLFVASALLFLLANRNSGHRRILLYFYALLFFFATGEEISWGQRIFGIESGDFFLEHNFQGETNLHNLVIGDQQLINFWLGPFLTLITLLYLVVTPFIYPYSGLVQRFMDLIAAPLASKWIAPVLIIASIVIYYIDGLRKWEIYECVFAIVICIVFLTPQNPTTFGFEDGRR